MLIPINSQTGSRSGSWSSSWRMPSLSWRRSKQHHSFPMIMAGSGKTTFGWLVEEETRLLWISSCLLDITLRGILLDTASEIPIGKSEWEKNKCTDSTSSYCRCAVRHILLEAECLFRGGALGSSSTGDEYRDFKNNPLHIDRCLKHPYGFLSVWARCSEDTYTPFDR